MIIKPAAAAAAAAKRISSDVRAVGRRGSRLAVRRVTFPLAAAAAAAAVAARFAAVDGIAPGAFAAAAAALAAAVQVYREGVSKLRQLLRLYAPALLHYKALRRQTDLLLNKGFLLEVLLLLLLLVWVYRC